MTDSQHSSSLPEDQLDVYLVGGAVRDCLMGIEQKDKDWVVVGATPQKMRQRGFKQVGKDFPVFLHPHSKEEYALARKERKVGKGYHGFEFDHSPEVTLQQDLQRRDLTINAMAMDAEGHLIDPFNGKQDIANKVLRHVSDAFVEDPVRILRVARFAARFNQLGFAVDQSTRDIIKTMVEKGEANALVAERVWRELFLSMQQGRVSVFIDELRQSNALKPIFPEIDALFGVPQTQEYHPEIDTGIHILLCLDAAQKLSDDDEIIFAVLLHDLGKGITDKAQLPSHKGHEQAGLPLVEEMCARLAVPKTFRRLALKVCQWHLHCHRMNELKPSTVLKLLTSLDAFRDPMVVDKFTLCCMADKRGRTGHADDDYEQRQQLKEYYQAALDIDMDAIVKDCQRQATDDLGGRINKQVEKMRIKNITEIKNALSA